MIGGAKTVSSHHFARLAVPDEQMHVMRIERIRVQGLPGPFTGATESQFAQPRDLAQYIRELSHRADVDVEVTGAGKHAFLRQRGDVALKQGGIHRGYKRPDGRVQRAQADT